MSVPDIVFEILLSGNDDSGCTPVAWHEDRQMLEVQPRSSSDRSVGTVVQPATIFVPVHLVEAFVANEPWTCPPGSIRGGALSRSGYLSSSPHAFFYPRSPKIFGWATVDRTVTGHLAWSDGCALELAACTVRRLCDLRPADRTVAPVREFIDTVFAYTAGDANLDDLHEAEAGVVTTMLYQLPAFPFSVFECCKYVHSPTDLVSLFAAATNRQALEMRTGGHSSRKKARRAEDAAQSADFMRIAARYADEVIAGSQP